MGWCATLRASGPSTSRYLPAALARSTPGEMVAKDAVVEIAGVRVSPGDWVMGDVDGVVFIPADNADAVFRAALNKIAAEDTTREELKAGDC